MIVDQFFTCRAMKRYLVTWLKHGVSQVQCSFKNTVVADLIFTFQQDLFVQNSLTLHFPPLPVRISLFYFYFILLYNTVLFLPYIDMNQPWLYMSSQSWTPLPPPTLYHLSGSSPYTSPKHPVSCIKHRLTIRFLHDSIHVSMPFSQIIPPSPSPTESKDWCYFLMFLS